MSQVFVSCMCERNNGFSPANYFLVFFLFLLVIPLAKKLKDCGVFGVSSAENLDYASANRAEWEQRGKEIVAGYVKKYAKADLSQDTGTSEVRPSMLLKAAAGQVINLRSSTSQRTASGSKSPVARTKSNDT